MRILLLAIIISILACKSDNTAISNASASSTKVDNNASPGTPQDRNVDTKSVSASEVVQKALESKPKVTSATTVKGNEKPGTNFNSEGIPDACDLLSTSTISKYVKVPADQIFINDGSSAKNPKSRGCFFKWDGDKIKNAGVMVQVQTNPVADEVPEYLKFFIESKKTQGEQDFTGNKLTKYLDWPGFGDDGAYSTELGKYVWRVGDDWAFMIAFNTSLSAKEQKRAAEEMAKEVMKKMVY